jgi:hypothetical protein
MRLVMCARNAATDLPDDLLRNVPLVHELLEPSSPQRRAQNFLHSGTIKRIQARTAPFEGYLRSPGGAH